MNIVIACGGTGGHLFPGLAVGEVLLQRGHQVMLIISEKKIDAVAVEGRSEFLIEKLPSVGMPSLLSIEIIPFLFRFLSGVSRCKQIFRNFKPDVILGMGGFTSTAPILAGQRFGARTFIHESNVIPGKANRLNAKIASKVLLGFEEAMERLPSAKCIVTGTPIRSALREIGDRAAIYEKLNLQPDKKTILITGGSQGASGINHAFCRIVNRFSEHPYQVIHLTGDRDPEMVGKSWADAGVPAYVSPFYHQMQELYQISDLVVSRSGASSLSETAYFGTASILIPYPYAAEDHQTRNAEVYAQGGAATVLKETEGLAERLYTEIVRILDTPDVLKEMKLAALELSPADAAFQVANCLENGGEKG